MAAAVLAPNPALWVAALKGQVEQARQLLLGGANIEEQGGRGASLYTPLQVAVLCDGHQRHVALEVVHLLLEHGALVTVTNNRGETPLHQAAYLGHEAVALLLLQHGADVEAKANGRTALHFAALGGHRAMAHLLLQHPSNVSVVDNVGMTALHFAALRGHEEVVEVLI
ncbi:ankyrin repeat-containing domain protein, partial [Baffinella frigidus]